MPGDPPDDSLRDLFSQVDAALTELNITDDATRDAVTAGLTEALSELAGRQKPSPSLRLVDDPQEPPQDEAPASRVKVVRSHRRPALQPEGRIAVEEGEAQTLHRSAAPRPYRLHCDTGELLVIADGQPLDAVRAGQSIDVEGAMLQVRGRKTSAGRFTRL